MEDWDIQNLNPPQGSGSGYTLPYIPFVALPLTPTTVSLRNGDPQLQSLLSQNCLPPPTPGQLSQTTRCGALGAIFPHQEALWPVSASGPQIGQITEACSSDYRDRIREFAEDQIHAYSSRPDWRNTHWGVSLQPTGVHPFGQADLPSASGSDVQIREPNMFFHQSHSRSSHVSPQKLEYVPGNQPISLFQHTLEFTGTRLVPKKKRAHGSNHVKEALKKWLCRYGDCNKKYWRRQELIRHIRDKHNVPRKCPFCGAKWTRGEKIRAHLITYHKDRLTEEELREIGVLQGREDTIWFLSTLGGD